LQTALAKRSLARLVLLAFRIVALGIGPTLKGEIMADTSVGGQSPGVPELVDILKQLGAHRRKAYEQAYGASKLRSKLDGIAETLLESLRDHDYRAAGKTLCRFVDAAGVECCDDARQRMLANLDAFMGSRLAALASGATGFKATFAELGPEAEAAFDLWDRSDKSHPLPGERDAYWHHPVLLVCRWLEEHSRINRDDKEHTPINRDDLEAAAFRLNTPLGLQGMEPLLAPDGATVHDKGASDMLWIVPKLQELDRNGTTAKLWGMLSDNCPTVLVEAGLMPAAHATPPTDRTGEREGSGEGNTSAEQAAVLDKRAILARLQPADRKAYLSYQYAETMAGRKLGDREAYDWLGENGIDTDKGDLGELADYELPTDFGTWSRQVRNARKPLSEQKYTKRDGRALGKSVVSARQIEYQRGDE